MNELSREELIGAYLDDELSSDERARAEKLLAENADLRQMLEELQVLRARLQALPRQSLPADFSQRVLQRAEREMLLGTTAAAAPHAAVLSREEQAPTTISMNRRWVRPLVYAGFAAAAALLIGIFLPGKGREDATVAVLDESNEAPRAAAPASDDLVATPDDGQSAQQSTMKSAPAMPAGERSVPAFAPQNAVRAKSADAPASRSAPPSAPPASSGATDDVLIVDLQITRGALARGEFEQLLQDAEIKVSDASPAPESKPEARAEAAGDAAPLSDQTRVKESLPGEALPADAELFYVEATSEQLEAALASIDELSGDFPAILLNPAEGNSEQVGWREQFRRIPASAEIEVAAEELDGGMRQTIDQLLSAEPALADEEAAAAETTATARRLSIAAETPNRADVAAVRPSLKTGRAGSEQQRIRAVFILRAVADPVTPPTQPAAGVE